LSWFGENGERRRRDRDNVGIMPKRKFELEYDVMTILKGEKWKTQHKYELSFIVCDTPTLSLLSVDDSDFRIVPNGADGQSWPLQKVHLAIEDLKGNQIKSTKHRKHLVHVVEVDNECPVESIEAFDNLDWEWSDDSF